ncbi:unnamed protein product [Ambrosiozyma monospora]|uniref:Unnamed protein product n=1 Tax=Ambrosiozyma monospora TaxID=43982 RepID=A0A9W7DGE5_AMBMO|nr:unnamed protein product [Ambrosiozyma monospora]
MPDSELNDSNISEEEPSFQPESHDTFQESGDAGQHEAHNIRQALQTWPSQSTSISHQTTDQPPNDKLPTRAELNNIVGMMRRIVQRYENIDPHSLKKKLITNSVPYSAVTKTIDLDVIEYHGNKESNLKNNQSQVNKPMINSNAIPTHSTTMSSKSPIPDQKNISLQNNDPITDQEKVRANFWAVAETAVQNIILKMGE